VARLRVEMHFERFAIERRALKQLLRKIVDEGPLPPNPIAGIKYNMETFDEVITENTVAFMDKAK
jgi:hypothetical protein